MDKNESTIAIRVFGTGFVAWVLLMAWRPSYDILLVIAAVLAAITHIVFAAGRWRQRTADTKEYWRSRAR